MAIFKNNTNKTVLVWDKEKKIKPIDVEPGQSIKINIDYDVYEVSAETIDVVEKRHSIKNKFRLH